MIRQHIQDIELQQLKFNDGDRILVKVAVDLGRCEYEKLERAVKKFTRAEVRILIVNCFEIKIFTVDTFNRHRTVVDTRSGLSLNKSTGSLGTASLNCSVISFDDVVRLVIFVPWINSDSHKKLIHSWISRWAGQDVEIEIKEGFFV